MSGLLILGLGVFGLLAGFAWVLLRVAAQADEDREQEWLAEEDERRTPKPEGVGMTADPITEAVAEMLPPDDLGEILRTRQVKPIVCGWCRGTGRRRARRVFNPDSWSTPVSVECSACKGRGTT